MNYNEKNRTQDYYENERIFAYIFITKQIIIILTISNFADLIQLGSHPCVQ